MMPRLVQSAPKAPPPRVAPFQLLPLGDELLKPAEADVTEPAEFDGSVSAQRRLRTGETAFFQGQAFQHLHVVRTGSFKISIALSDGRGQVSQFSFPGDLMGLDGLGGGIHASTATALQDSVVCWVSLTNLRDAATRTTPWHEVLHRRLGQEIVRDQTRMLLLGNTAAAARLAAFLLEVSDRMQLNGYSPREFHLCMSRADIGSYLGLRLETVSRLLSGFQQQSIVRVDKRHIVICSFERLREVRDRNCD